ncbi:DUF11 domain-containing protein [Lacihabitans sp. LS3-19]|uniref:SdrD B-like domain-containing protein n=1 Tax=Lacihabitans sp. LS3-19 TaxID=2487335 RepID=UPI0020CD1729|nr:SdrD B-like domain-containing protein [Lacihabitans sp. LS3-19]MCP9769661.1 DUF11 domain-containing protein [Lacihabitans sp. LS3-19]
MENIYKIKPVANSKSPLSKSIESRKSLFGKNKIEINSVSGNVLCDNPQNGHLEIKHNNMINSNLFIKTLGNNNYNFTFYKFMKQLSFLIKFVSLLLPFKFFNANAIKDRFGGVGYLDTGKQNFAKFNIAAAIFFVFASSFAFAAEVDLAVKQKVDNSMPTVGSTVKYTVTLVNQGNTTATNIVVEDVVPIGGLGAVSATQTGGSWSYIGGTGIGTWTVPSLAGGDSLLLEISGTVLTQGVFFNIAEIKSSPDTDIDSVPGNSDLSEDDIATSCFSVPIPFYSGDQYTVEVPAPFSYGTGIVWYRNNLPIGPGSPFATVNGDNSLTINDIGSYTFTTNLTTCSATGCCAIIFEQGSIFDLALTKMPNVNTVVAGGQITYTIKVYNQGNIVATNIQVSDYIPTGLTLADANWSASGGVATLVSPIATLAAGDTATRTITFNVSSTYTGSLSNSAEISSAKGPSGENVTDIDSDLDNNPNNNGTPIDDEITQNGKTGGDNDNSDIGVITVTPAPIFDLALRKTSVSTSVVAGGQVTFDIHVFNQGNLEATNVQISDYIPTGLTLADANWTATGGIATRITPIASILVGDTAKLTITFNVSPTFSGALTNSAEISAAQGPGGSVVTDIDSNPDNNPANDGTSQDDVITGNGKTGGDEDDFDISTINVTTVPVFDLALRKTVLTTGPIYPGSTVTFKIDVFNQGTVMATGVKITDYIPAGLTLADPDWTQSGATALFNNPSLVILAGQSVPLTIDFVVSSTFAGGPVRNSAEISDAKGPSGEVVTDIDSNPDSNPANDGTSIDDEIAQNGKTGGDEDDSDFADITVTPVASIGNFVWLDVNQNGVQDPGETGIGGVLVTLERPDGSFVASTTTDPSGAYLFANLVPGSYVVVFGKPSGYSSSPANSGGDDAKDSDADMTTGKSGVYVLAAGEYNQTIDAGFYLPSCADIISISAVDSDICSGDSTNLVATSSNGISINWYLVPSGGTPMFTTNSGQNHLVFPTTTTVYYAQLSNVALGCPTDRTPVALVVNQRPLNPSCGSIIEICTGTTADLNTHIINGITTPGGTFEWHTGFLPSSPLVANPSAVGVGTYYLFEKSGAGCYSNPTQAVVSAKSCELTIDLSLLKTANMRTVNVNDNIIYTIEVANAGPDAATNVVIEDKLPSGLQFVSSSSFANASGTLTAAIPTIAAGQTIYLTYTAKAIGTGTLINVAEVKSADQRDSDSTPGNGSTVNEDDDDDEIVNVITPNPIADLSLQKLVNNSSPSVGDNIIYTIRVSNAGPNNATNVEVTDILPAGLTLVSVTGADVNSNSGNTATASFATILANSQDEFYITATVTGTGSITNRAEVTKSDQLDPDSTPNNGGNEDDDDTNTITVQQLCNPTTPLISCANPYICPGESVSISAIGCNGTVVWSNGMTGNIITVSPSVTTIYNAKCQVGTCLSPNSNNIQIIVNTVAPPLVTASSTTVCTGGSVILTASGCTGTITWNNGVLGSSIEVSPSAPVTSYTATCRILTCISNPSSPISITLTGNPTAPAISASNSNICVGQSTVLTAVGCSGTVTWSNGQTGATVTVSPVATTVYTATCSTGTCVSPASAGLTINVGSSQTPTILASNSNTCGNEPVTLTVSNCSGGVLWSNGATTLSTIVTPVATTTYSVTCGTGTCAATAQTTINVGGLGMTPTIIASVNNVCENTPVVLSASNCTGTISWSLSSNTSVVLGTGSTITVTPSTTTSYTATCATGTGCSGYATIAINVTPNSVAPIVTCGAERICSGDSLVFTAHNCTGTVNWSNGATGNIMVVRPLVSTTYSATCTVNGCVSPASTPVLIQVITEIPVITASSETVCPGGNVTLTASNCSGTLAWSTGQTTVAITVNPSVATTYSVTCTVEGCVGSASKTINIGTGQTPTIIASENNVCAGTSVVLTASNCSSSITWNTGATGNTITVSPSSNSTYTASCGNISCAGTASITINVVPAQTPVVTTTNAFICAGQSTTLTASGCSGGLSWNTGQTSATITVSPTVNTTYTVSCGSGSCVRTMSQEIIVGSQIIPTVTASNNNICSGESVTITATNCSSGIVWNNGATTSSITVTPSATIEYTATCGTGSCAGSASVTINVGSGQTPTISTTNLNICAGQSTTLTVANCASPISWNTGSNSATITVSPSQNSTYVVTCGSGACQKTASLEIIVGFQTIPTLTASNGNICSGESITLTASNCSSGLTWSTGATTATITVSPLVTTTYSATCGTGNCAGTGSVLVNVSTNGGTPPSITASNTQLCQAGSVTLTATNCSGTVNWSNSQSGSSITVTVSTTQTFTATCSSGTCVSVASNPVTVTVGSPAAPVITSNGTVVCNGSSVILTATQCAGTILWSNGMTGSEITVNPVVTTTYSAICRMSNENCDSPSSNTIRIETSDIPNPPTITCSASRICVGESLVLTAIGCEGTVTWHYDNTTATGSTLNINPLVTTVYTTTCSIGNCVSTSSGAATITVGNPIPPIVTCNNTVICSGLTTNLEAAGCVGTVIWSNGMEGAVVSVSPTTLTTYYAICDAGLCQSGQSNSISVVVTGAGVSKPTVNDIVNVCPNTTADLTTAVTSQAPVGGSIIYRTGNSPTSPAVSNPSAISSTGTFYAFTSSGNGCYSEGARINVGIVSCENPIDCTTDPATASVGANQTLCVSTDYIELNGSIGGAATTSTWTTNGTGTFENSIAPVTKYFMSAQDIINGSVTLTLTTNDPDNGGSCQAASASKVVTLNGVGSIPTLTSSKSPIICLGDSVTLTASEEGTFGYMWSNGATTKSIVVKTPGTYTVKYINGSSCMSLSSEGIQVDMSNNLAAPTVTSQTANTCPTTTVDLVSKITGNPTTSGGVFEFHVSNSPTSSMLATANAVGEGTYYVFEKTATGCYSNSSSITVTIDDCNVVQGDADIQVNITGNKTSVVIGDQVTYTLQVKNNGPSDATNVEVINLIPEGLELVGGTPGLLTEGNNLKVVIPTLAVGVTKTYTYVAKLTKAGAVVNVINKVSADQNDPINSNNTDDFSIECTSCQETCISTALKADTTLQSNGSYNIKFTALLKNCGNVALTGIELIENLSNMFASPTQFTVIQKPTPNAGSSLVGNDSFNGSSDIAVLNKMTSTLAVGKIDTVTFVINLLPMGTEGPYSTNTIAKAVGMTAFGIAQNVSDVSNDGSIVVADLDDPTVVKLFKSPSIAIVLAVIDTVKQANDSYNVTFQAIVKNNGSLDLSNVIVTDTLSKYFGNPASYTMVGTAIPVGSTTLAVNPNFNGSTDPALTLSPSTLPIGKQDTIWFTINLVTGGKTEFQNQAIAQGTGTLTNGTTSTVVDLSNSGVNPDEPGSSPTQLIFGTQDQGSEITTCVGLALTTINKQKLEDGTYNVTYQAIIKNCGNLNLTNVAICDTLSNTFSSPTEVVVTVKPYLNAGSSLVADTSFNGVDNTCLLKSTVSSLGSAQTDTLRWTINIKLNSNNGPFRNNVTVTSISPSGQVVSDISNDGINPAPEGSNPTILNFNDNIPDELIGLAKNLVSITPVDNRPKVFDVEFKFVMKNYGIVPFDKVQLQDNLAYTFGDKVIIDSVMIKDAETGIVANSNYTGKGELTNMLADSISSLPLKTTKTIGLVVRVDMNLADTLKYENIALAIGYFTGGSTSDPSVNGLNPDKNLSGDPSDDSDPTVIDFTGLLDLTPVTPLGIAKSVDTLSSADGSYLLTYKVIVKNYGSVTLDSIQLTDDLADVFSNNTQYVLMGVPTLNDSSTLKVNAAFNGDSTKGLLLPSESSLLPGQSDTLTFKVKVLNTDAEAQTYLNTVNGTALSGTTIVTDKSSTGMIPDKNNDGNPGNDNEPTAITIEPATEDTSAVEVLITNGLSPNGDTQNDLLVIKDKNNAVTLTADDNIEVFIYNRWGHLIYRSENYIRDTESGKGWNGGSNQGIRLENDAFVADGTYYYVVTSTNARLFGGKPVVNYITVKR